MQAKSFLRLIKFYELQKFNELSDEELIVLIEALDTAKTVAIFIQRQKARAKVHHENGSEG